MDSVSSLKNTMATLGFGPPTVRWESMNSRTSEFSSGQLLISSALSNST